MSAITVIYNLNERPVSSKSMEEALDSLKHRGSDDKGIWINKWIGLAHRMRWTTPESINENLPLQSKVSSAVITCDARIDNRKELISQLSFLDKPPKEITDSEIILRAYEKWGEDCLPRLIGDFVFAIWDDKYQKLFCARDALGVKHFYYYYKLGEIFILASEIKSIFRISNNLTELDEEHLGNYLTLNLDNKESTFYKNIKRLPATKAIAVTKNNFRVWQYWAPHPTNEIKLGNINEYHDAFREKFTEAVVCRLRSAYPIGSMLSGGLDSSSIVCVASKYLASEKRPAIHTFSAIFPNISKIDKRIDELSFMNSAINYSGCLPHFVNCDDASPLIDMNKMMWHIEQPLVGANAYIDWNSYKIAYDKDLRVMLSGIDGDSTVSYGYEDFANMIKRGYWWRLFKNAFALKKNMPRKDHTYKELLWRQGLASAFPSFDNLWQHLRNKNTPNSERDNEKPLQIKILNKSFNKRYNFEDKNNQEDYISDDSTNIEKHWYSLKSGLMAYNLELLEKLSQAFAIDQWYPFCDRRLIEFCISLPPGLRIYRGWTRSILRHAMDNILPTDIQWRKDKAVLSAGIRLNFLKFELKQLENTIGRDSWIIDNFVDIKFVKELLKQHKDNPLKPGMTNILLVNLVYLSNWLRNNRLA